MSMDLENQSNSDNQTLKESLVKDGKKPITGNFRHNYKKDSKESKKKKDAGDKSE